MLLRATSTRVLLFFENHVGNRFKTAFKNVSANRLNWSGITFSRSGITLSRASKN